MDDLAARIEALTDENERLRRRVDELEADNDHLEQAIKHWVFMHYWQQQGLGVDAARIHAAAFVASGLAAFRATQHTSASGCVG